MIKALKIGCFMVAFWLVATCAFAISLADAAKASGVKQPNTQTHVTVGVGGCKVYGFTVTASANGGYAQLVDANTTPNERTTAAVIRQHITGSAVTDGANKVLAHIQVGTALNTQTITIPQGIACGGKLYLDTVDAFAEVYYKE